MHAIYSEYQLFFNKFDLANNLVNHENMNVTIHEAKTNLSKLIQEAIHGEEVIISKGKQPIVKIIPLSEAYPDRRFDGERGLIKYMANDFNDEISDFDE